MKVQTDPKINKAIIISAPSGAGKTSIVKQLLAALPELEFSISACSRPKRENETDGKDYYFLTAEEFRRRIEAGEFAEWQEVYPGNYYGTLRSELERIRKHNRIPLFDLDVIGGLNLKKFFGDAALAAFIAPPSLKELENRLRNRNTESEESLNTRIAKMEYEMGFAGKFDLVIVNDDLEKSVSDAIERVRQFIDSAAALPQR
ncbi:MAG TPA: guanylate kinase [Bacteroidales bacterium]|nr:guanylate kinase [Bacteroidales bacterium]